MLGNSSNDPHLSVSLCEKRLRPKRADTGSAGKPSIWPFARKNPQGFSRSKSVYFLNYAKVLKYSQTSSASASMSSPAAARAGISFCIWRRPLYMAFTLPKYPVNRGSLTGV